MEVGGTVQYYPIRHMEPSFMPRIGLEYWPVYNLARLSHTPFEVSEATWVGQPLLDCHERPFARVRDLLVQARCAEDTRAASGVSARYAVVACGGSLPWRPAPELYVPVEGICNVAGQLRVSQDAAELWLGLFGQELPHA